MARTRASLVAGLTALLSCLPASAGYFKEYPAKSLQHQVGYVAYDGSALTAPAGQSGYLVYGPYTGDRELQSGPILVTFTLSVDDNTRDNEYLFHMDVTSWGVPWEANREVANARRWVRRREFDGASKLQDFSMIFLLSKTRSAVNVEYRLVTYGRATVSVTKVTAQSWAPAAVKDLSPLFEVMDGSYFKFGHNLGQAVRVPLKESLAPFTAESLQLGYVPAWTTTDIGWGQGHMTYGPYKTYPARQTYLVTFVLGSTGWASGGDNNIPIFNVDVADSRTGTVLAQANIPYNTFNRQKGLLEVPLLFRPFVDDSLIEFRVYWVCCVQIVHHKTVVGIPPSPSPSAGASPTATPSQGPPSPTPTPTGTPTPSLSPGASASASPSSYPQMDLSGLRVGTDGKGDFSLAAFDASLQAAAAKHGVAVVLTGNPELAGSKISVAAAQGAAKAAAEGLSGAQAAQAAAAAAASAQKEAAAATPVAVAAAASPVAAAAAAATALPSPGGVGKSAENTLGPPVQVVRVIDVAPPGSDQAKPGAGAAGEAAAAGGGAGTATASAGDASAGVASALLSPLAGGADASAAREVVDRLPNGAVRIRRTVTTRKVDVRTGLSNVSVKVTSSSSGTSSVSSGSQASTAGSGTGAVAGNAAGAAAGASGGSSGAIPASVSGAATGSPAGAGAGAAGSAATQSGGGSSVTAPKQSTEAGAGAGGAAGAASSNASAQGAQAADAGRSLLRSNKE